MTASRFPIGTTRRRSGAAGSLRHAATWRRRTEHGRTYEALCGAGVYHHHTGEKFDPDHERACPRCVKAVEQTPVSGRMP